MDKTGVWCWLDCTDAELRKRIEPIIFEVLRAAWPDVKDRIHTLEFVLPTTSFYKHPSSPHKHLIFLEQTQMLWATEWKRRYIVSHELAHFMLEGGDEMAADALVVKWGFRKDMEIVKGVSS